MNPTPTRQPLQRALHPAEDSNPDELIGDPVEPEVSLDGLQVIEDEDGGDHPDDQGDEVTEP